MENEVKTLPLGTAYEMPQVGQVKTIGFVTADDGESDYIHGTEVWYAGGQLWRLVADACHRREELILLRGVAA